MLAGFIDDKEIEDISLQLFGSLSLKDNDNDIKGTNGKSPKASVVAIMEAKGSELIRKLQKMVQFERLSEEKKKSAMVSHLMCVYMN